MTRDHRPDIFLIQETKMKKEKVESIIFNKGIKITATNFEGASGGLLVLWKDGLKALIIFYEGKIFLIQF